MKMRTLTAAVVILLAGSVSLGQEAVKKPVFAGVVTERFDAWDADDDGTLSAGEIDKACVDPSIKGAEAAAVSAIKRIVRSEKYELPALTKEYLTKAPTGRKPAAAPKGDSDREDSTERDGAGAVEKSKGADGGVALPRTPAAGMAAKLTTRPDFAGRFKNCMDRIEQTDRELFKSESELTIDHCHQGPLGDCFFVSVVGAAVKRDAAGVRSMISERPASEGGGYTVKFGTGREVKVAALTDAEIAISSTTQDKGGDDGVWLAVLEKAFGTSRLQDMPDRFETESATDAIAKGGSTATSIRLLTGHTTERITLKRRQPWTMQQFDANRRLLPPPAGTKVAMRPAEDLPALEQKVREKVSSALAGRRIVAAGTGEEKHPPGISGKHAYAVLSYEASRDVLTLWNPHGNSFVMRSGREAGLETGYATKAGVFEMPVKDFVRVFNGVTIETERESGKGRRG